MNEACIKQIRYWSLALRQANKAIRRKNRFIRRLQCQNDELHQKVAELMLNIAEKELPQK